MSKRDRKTQRTRERARYAAAHRRRALLWRGGLAIAVLAAAFFVLQGFGAFEPPGAAIDLNAPQYRASRGEAIGTRVEVGGGGHVPDSRRVSYSTTPTTGGAHWQRWADWGIKDAAEPEERVTHNLEHGGIIVGYRDVAGEQLERLKGVVQALRRGGYPKIVLQPYPALRDAKVAVTAWGWILQLPDLDEAQLVRFVKAHYASSEAPEPNGP